MTSHRASDPYGSATPSSDGSSTQQAADAARAGKDAAADVAQQGKQAASDVAQHGKQAASDVAQHGTQAAGEVASTATDAAKDVAQETKAQAQDLLGRTKTQLDEQARSQQSALAETLHSLGEQLTEMTQHVEHQGTAVDLAATGRDRVKDAAQWLDSHEPADVLDQLRKVGRNSPGAFLLGAVAAGVVAGRLARGAVDERRDTADTSGTTGTTGTTGITGGSTGTTDFRRPSTGLPPAPSTTPTPVYGQTQAGTGLGGGTVAR